MATMQEYSILYVNHHWKIISNSLDACENCPHSEVMEEINVDAAERLVYTGDYSWKEL